MESRWLLCRHREISEQVLNEERREAVGQWSERRARVEEEILRNAEVSRYCSTLRRRAYSMPADASEDIEDTVQAAARRGEISPSSPKGGASGQESGGDEVSGGVSGQVSEAPRTAAPEAKTPTRKSGARSSVQAPFGTSAPQRPAPGKKEDGPPRYDCTQINASKVREDEAKEEKANQVARAARSTMQLAWRANDRVAYLRRLNRNLLRTGEDDASDSDDDEATRGQNFFETPEGVGHISLSAYTRDATQAADGDDMAGTAAPRAQDDSDVLGSICEKWRTRQLPNSALKSDGLVTLEEMRLQQLQEVEKIKRTFGKRGVPISAAVLERALVMPQQRLYQHPKMLNSEPKLLENPIPPEVTAKKKGKGGPRKMGKRR